MFASLFLVSCSIFKRKMLKKSHPLPAGNIIIRTMVDLRLLLVAEQQTGPGLVLIEGGRFTMGQVAQDVLFDWNNKPRTVTVSSFYMDETEVRNVDYREYLFWLRSVYVDYPEVYRRALPDTLVWRSPMGFNDPYVQYYFRHPSYNNYPVVGVSWIKANDYSALENRQGQ